MNDQTTRYPATSAAPPAQGNTTLIIVAVVMGVIVVALSNWYINSIRKQVNQATITIYKLNKPVEPGDKFRSDRDVAKVIVPKSLADGFSDALREKDLSAWHNQPFKQPARENDLLTMRLFVESGGIDGSLPEEGMAAVPLPVSSKNAPGVLRPGMRVDIIATLTQEGRLPQAIPVMRNVRVRAVGTRTDGGSERRGSYSSITVQVTPKEAVQLLTVSDFVGKDGFHVIVRNPADDDVDFVGVNKEVLKIVGLER